MTDRPPAVPPARAAAAGRAPAAGTGLTGLEFTGTELTGVDSRGAVPSKAVMEAEIDQDRRSERRLVWYTVIALAVVAIMMTARLIFL